MKTCSYIFGLLTCIGMVLPGYAQVGRNKTLTRSALHRLEYEIKADFSIGGTAPFPLLVEIRSIDGYNPTLTTSIEGEVTKRIAVQSKLGIIVGLRLENKAITTEAIVKNYNMKILGQEGEGISGAWTGEVKTRVYTAGLTIPLMAIHKLANRWNIKTRPYFSYLLSREFPDYVYEGYLRENNPTGPKVEFTDGKITTYDFSDDLRHFQWELQIGAGQQTFEHSNAHADPIRGLDDIFKNDFNTITFVICPIYLSIGFGYVS